MTITANMNLTVPAVSITAGPAWANEINGDLSLIDSHDHTFGNGVAIPVAALNINGDLSFLTSSGNFSLTNLKSAQFYNQASLASDYALYVSNDDLYYNTAGGVAVQLTTGNSPAGGGGSIGGLPSGTASVSYATGVYTFEQSTNVPATVDAGYLNLRPQSAGANAIQIRAPSGTPGYTLTLPSTTPSGQSMLGVIAGGTTNYVTIDGTTLVFASGPQLRVGTVQLANMGAASVGTTQVVNSSITGAKMANLAFTQCPSTNTNTISGNGTWQSVFFTPVTFNVTALRPILLIASGDPNAGVGGFFSCSTTDAEIRIRGYKSLTNVYENYMSISTGLKYAPSALCCIMMPTSTGSWSFNVEVNQASGSSALFKNIFFNAYQL